MLTLKQVLTTTVVRTVLVLAIRVLAIPVLAIPLSAAMPAGAAEEDSSASLLLPYCKLASGQPGNKAFLAGRCVGLVQGVADTLALMKQADAHNNIVQLCIDRPRTAGTSQAVEAVVKYGDSHPDQTRAPLTVVAALALTEAWACHK